MNPVISQTFAVTAVKPTISVDHIDNYYITEASGIMPAVSDSRWQLVPDGQQVPVPTASAPYLWHKYITYLTDGSALDPIVEFAGSLGQNGFDYDLVPSHSAIIKDANDNLSPANVSCSLIKRNADGSAETQSVVPSGYSVIVYRDNTSSSYTLGSNVSTAGITSVITFVLKYGNIEVERHDLRVIAEGAEGLTGRGIQSQDTRFKATTTNSIPATPTNDNTWNTWSSLASCGYSQSKPYLWKCIKTVYLNGNGTTETEYLVEGPTVWGQDGADAIFIDLDNEMDAIPCDSTGKVTVATTLVTYARLYRGPAIINDGLTAPVAANCKLGSVTPTITPQQDGAYKLEWVFAVNTQLSADRLTASIAIGYASKSYPAVFTANVVKSGAPGVSPAIYQLLLSQNDASFARNSSNQLTPASISIRCGYTKNYNGSIVKHDGDQASDLQNIDGTYNILYRAIAANGSPGNWAWMKDLSSSNFYLVIPNSTTNTAYEFILTTANSASAVAESNIFDRETLPINKDGLNGAPGESALIIDLDNEQDAFGTKADGKIAASVSRETTASMFYGITPLSATYSTTKTYEDGTTCGSEVSVDVNSETGKITVTMGSTSHVYNKTIFIDITGTASGYTDKPKTARFTIQPQAAGTDGLTPVIYQLMPSPSSLSFARNADGTLNMANNVITGYVKKIVDEETTILSSLSGYRIYYGYGNPATPSNFISVGDTITVSASNAASYASLVLELWKMNGSTKEKRLDRETIPINKEGQKGQQGDPGDTPFIIDIDNEMTSIPISTDGKVESQITLDFHLAAYYGSTNVINDCTVSLVGTAPTGFNVDVVTDKTTPRIVIAANTQPAEITELRFQVVHSDYGTRQTVFSIAAVKSGGKGQDAVMYELLPSDTAVTIGRDNNGDLNQTTATLKCGYTKRIGNQTPSTNSDVSSSFDGYNIYFRRKSRSNGTWSSFYLYSYYKSYYLTDFSVTTYSDIQFIICTNTSYTVTESNVTGLIDRETVPIVLDGQKGKQGDNAFVLDIDNEMAAIPVNEQGKTTGALALDFGLNAFYGTTSVLNDCTVTVDGSAPNGFTVDLTDKFNPSISIAANIQPAEVTDIVLKAVHATYGTRYATFTVCAVKSGGRGEDAEIYQLKPSHTALQFARNSSGDLTGSYTLTCQIQKTVGSTTTNHDSLSGYYIYYGWDGAASPSTSLPTTGRSVGTSEAASHTSVVLELWRGQRSASGSVRLDRETIPILKDGTKGGPGDPGNGINGIYFYRMFTQSFEAPAENDSGWIASTSGSYPTEAGLTKENRYLWQKKLTSYTRSDTPTIEISLLAQFDTGVQENLLEDTAFLSEGQMEAWETKNGNIMGNAVGAHNGFYLTPDFTQVVTEMLQQKVYKSGELQKLKANTWYTLSFWGAMTQYHDLLSSSVYNTANTNYWIVDGSKKGFYIAAGRTAIVTVTGRCYSSQVYLRVYGYCTDDNGTWLQSTSVKITSTSNRTVSFKITNNQSTDKIFYVEGYVYKSDDSQNHESGLNYRCYMSLIRIDRGAKLLTYLYRSDNGQAVQASASVPWYVNGKKYTQNTHLNDVGRSVTLDDGTTGCVQDGTVVQFSQDGAMQWQLQPGMRKCTVTFKTPSSLATGVYYRVLFRSWAFSHGGWISMPKLEENTIATDWIENTNDRMADDIQHVYDGPWESGKTYFYGGGTGVRHVVRAKESVSGAMTYWRMKQRTTSSGYTSTTQPYNDTTHWEKASYLKFIATDFILADEASINLMNTNRVLVMASDGSTVAAGLGGAELGDTDYPLWIGATYVNRANAPFKVNLLGHVFATRGTVGGWVLKDGMLISQLGKINGSYSNDYDNENFVPNISFNALAGEVIAGQNLRLSDVGLQLYGNNRLCAKIANQSISQQIDTTPSIASATLSKSVSDSIYLPTGDSRYTGTAKWQISQDFGYMYNGSTIQLRNANFSCSLPSSVGVNTFHYNTGKVSVILSNGSKDIVIDSYTTYVGSNNSISANRTFDRTITIDGETYPEGRYYVYYKVEVNYSVSGGQSGSSSATTFQLSNAYYRYSRTVEQVCLIGNNGLFNRQGAQCYLMSTQYGFKTQYGNYILEIGSSGIRYSKNNGSSWTTL